MTDFNSCKGRSACGGFAVGKARVILNLDHLEEIEHGDILITKETDISFVPAMLKAGAIVTEVGGRFCHAAIWAREHKKPTILQVKNATEILQGIPIIYLDADLGVIEWEVNPAI